MATRKRSVYNRNIIVLGKIGSGKSTVCNHIVGRESFAVCSSVGRSERRKVSFAELRTHTSTDVEYHIKVADTQVGLRFFKSSSRVVDQLKQKVSKRFPEGVNLLLFVYKSGRFTKEERECIDAIIRNFGPQFSDISALVVTGCEQMGAEERRELVDEFKSSELTKDIANFMRKGIYPVGFPDTTKLVEPIKTQCVGIANKDEESLRHLVYKCEEVQQLFQWQETSCKLLCMLR